MSEEESVPDWVTSGQPDEQEPEEEGGAAPSDMFSRLDTDGDGVVSREEFEFAMGGPTLTGQVSGFETQDGTWSEGPGGQPSKKISNTTQFFLGLIGGPVGILIVGWIFIVLGEVTGEFDMFTSISMLSSAGLVIGGTAWGFTTGHQSFAWGLFTAFVAIPLILFGICVGIFLVFYSW